MPPHRPLLPYTLLLFLCALPAWAAAQLTPLPPPVKKDTTAVRDSAAANGDSTARDTTRPARPDTISWSSDEFYYDAGDDRFTLYRKAALKYQGYQLQADSIRFDNKEETVEAWGGPMIKDERNPDISGLRLKYNHKRRIGEMYYGASRRDGQSYYGMEIRRQRNGEIWITRGDFTPCDSRSFFFYSRRLVLEPNKKVIARPIVMNIGEVPVAVVPMYVMPVGKGRRSGFLRPKMGGDQVQGFFIRDLGWYWAMSEYMDFLMSGDVIEGQLGTFDKTNLRGDYRYAKRYTLSGNLSGSAYVTEFDPANSGWEVNFQHDQSLVPDGSQKLTGHGRFVSDSRVLKEALEEKEAVNQTANARLGYTHNLEWNQARLAVNASQDYNLTTGQMERELPAASFAFGAPLFPPPEGKARAARAAWYQKLNYSYSGDFNVYSREVPAGFSAYGRSAAADSITYAGARNQVSLSGKYEWFRYLNLTPRADVAEYWSLQSAIGQGGAPQMDFDPAAGRFGDQVFKYSTGVSTSTKLYGVGNLDLGRLDKMRHVITPSAGFTYTPHIAPQSSYVPHPRFPVADSQSKARTVSLGLGNDVDLKWKVADTSAAAKKGAASYKILATTSNVSYNFEAPERKWSDISTVVRTEMVRNVPLSVSLSHRLYDDFGPEELKNEVTWPILMAYRFGWRKGIPLGGELSTGGAPPPEGKANGGKAAREPGARAAPVDKKPWSANLDYGFDYGARRVSRGVFQKTITHSFDASLKLSPTPSWEMSYATSYDFQRGEFAQHSFAFNRTSSCWKMDFSWSPVGISQGWFFKIYLTELPDLKLESSNTNLRR